MLNEKILRNRENFKSFLKKNPLILAPMDDVTDIAFRELAEEQGALYTITELTSVEALIRDKVLKSRFEKGNLKTNVVQLFGSNPESFLEAAKKIAVEADIIDINFGCPSPRVTSNQSGSALLKDPKNVYEIISILVKNIDKPITAKIRLGYEKTNYLEIAKKIEKAGACAIAVHGRTAKQKYSGKADWNAIKEIYQQVKIPIIGNGDISSEEDIDKYLNSHCDALMIGRAAIGNPYIFTKVNHYIKTKQKLNLTQNEKKEIQKKLFCSYIEKLKKYDFYRINLKIQHQAMWFFKGIEGAKELRKKLIQTKNINEILKIVSEF